MILASIQHRLAKVEASRRPPRGLFFVAWGRTPDEIENALGRAQRARLLTQGDRVARCLWPPGSPVPVSRWALDEMHTFTQAEFAALMDEVDRLQDDWLAALHEAAEESGGPSPVSMDGDPPPVERDPGVSDRTDAALFNVILAVPLNGSSPTLAEERMQRALRYMMHANLRDRIRGRATLRPTQH